jgi:hypothetical protein
MKDYDKEAKYLNRPSKTQMSELKKKKKKKQSGGVVVGGRHSVGGGHQTA